MNRQEFEQSFNKGAASVWAWSQVHTTTAVGLVCFVAGYVLRWIIG